MKPSKDYKNYSCKKTNTSLAFFCAGILKLGIPSLTASTPVSAVHPEENAFKNNNIVKSCHFLFNLLLHGFTPKLKP